MDWPADNRLGPNVAAQAAFRLRFGTLVASLLVVVFFVAIHDERSTAAAVVAMYVLYVLYASATYRFAKRSNVRSLRHLVVTTAIIDPLFLTIWLFLAGDSGHLVVGMYLFTILGFGFRIGAAAMHICQAVSLVGFVSVLVVSPFWRQHFMFALSHVFLLAVVPVYAAFLIRRIQTATAQAEDASLAKTRLLAKVSHELRTPLTGITAAAELLEVESGEPATIRRAVSIQRLAYRLETEVKQLLQLSTLEHSGSRRMENRQTFMPSELATQAFKNLESVAEGKALSLHLDFDDALAKPVYGLHDEILAVLMNLSGNAVKFTAKGAITLQFRMVAGTESSYQMLFGVRDTGIGIAPQHLERIFEPFYQVDEGGLHSVGGTGLGTTIARELVRTMGGELQVESAVGKGSRFWFVLNLPIVAVPEGTAPARERPANERRVARKHVLLADDNAMNLDLMAEMMRKDGHTVTAVPGGHAALETLATRAFDIIFLDYNMDEVDGAMVLQTYRFSRTKPAPVFFVTADTTPMTEESLAGIGAMGVIHKPLTFSKLRRAFYTAFPEDAVSQPVGAEHAAASPAPGLAVVPVAYLDTAILEELREIRDTPGFLARIVAEGMHDIERLATELSLACTHTDLHAVHRAAHTLKGVSVNIGAVRMATLADRLMGLTYDELLSSPQRWSEGVVETAAETLKALGELGRNLIPPQAVND